MMPPASDHVSLMPPSSVVPTHPALPRAHPVQGGPSQNKVVSRPPPFPLHLGQLLLVINKNRQL